MLWVTIKQQLFLNNLVSGWDHAFNVLLKSIIKVQLLHSECDTQIGRSQWTSKSHGLISVDMWSNLNFIEMLFDNFGN